MTQIAETIPKHIHKLEMDTERAKHQAHMPFHSSWIHSNSTSSQRQGRWKKQFDWFTHGRNTEQNPSLSTIRTIDSFRSGELIDVGLSPRSPPKVDGKRRKKERACDTIHTTTLFSFSFSFSFSFFKKETDDDDIGDDKAAIKLEIRRPSHTKAKKKQKRKKFQPGPTPFPKPRSTVVIV